MVSISFIDGSSSFFVCLCGFCVMANRVLWTATERDETKIPNDDLCFKLIRSGIKEF